MRNLQSSLGFGTIEFNVVHAGGKEYDCIYLKPKGSNSVVLANELVTVSVPNKYIRKVK